MLWRYCVRRHSSTARSLCRNNPFVHVCILTAAACFPTRRIVSNIHAVLGSYATARVFWESPEILSEDILVPNYEARVIVALSTGFFTCDLAIVLMFAHRMTNVGPTILHHIVGMVGFYSPLVGILSTFMLLLFVFV